MDELKRTRSASRFSRNEVSSAGEFCSVLCLKSYVSFPSNLNHKRESAYLEQSQMGVYLRDMVTLLMCKGHKSQKENVGLLREYCKDVLTGNNIVGREYAYVSSTHINR
jgi:hypothetical protein